MSSSTSPNHSDLPLAGLKVVDLSQGVAGPHCGMLFAQYGADVVKVEPTAGDWGRAIGAQHGDFCAYFAAFNRGKRSLAVNLKSEFGLDAVKTLMAQADVVIENYRPGVLKRFGLDYSSVVVDNTDVIYVSVTGFGQSGPLSASPATDSILQSYSGLMSVNRDERGTPQRIGVLVIDVVTGLYAYQAAATALYGRLTRGHGKHIEVSLMDSVGALQAGKMLEFHLEGAEGKKPGVPVGTFALADGFMTINARRDSHFNALCEIIGRSDLLDDSRFSTSVARLDHEDELMPLIREPLKSWTRDKLGRELERLDILHAPVNDYADYFTDEHVVQSQAISWVVHPTVGEIPIHRVPGLVTQTTGPLAVSPTIGEHSGEVLKQVGFTNDAIHAAFSSHAVSGSTRTVDEAHTAKTS